MADRIAVLVVLEFIWISLNIVGLTAEATTDGDDIIKQQEAIDSLLQQSGGDAVSSARIYGVSWTDFARIMTNFALETLSRQTKMTTSQLNRQSQLLGFILNAGLLLANLNKALVVFILTLPLVASVALVWASLTAGITLPIGKRHSDGDDLLLGPITGGGGYPDYDAIDLINEKFNDQRPGSVPPAAHNAKMKNKFLTLQQKMKKVGSFPYILMAVHRSYNDVT